MANITELRSPEAALKAALPENGAIPDSVGANAIRAARMEKKLREGGASATLESMAGQVHKADADRALLANIGVEVNSDGTKKLNSQEQARLDRAVKIEKLNQAVGDGSYDRLGNREKAIIRSRVESTLRRVPQLDTILTNLGGGKDDYLDQIIKNQAFMSVIRKTHNTKLEEGDVEDHGVHAKRAEWAQRNEEVESREATLKGIDQDLQLLARKIGENQGLDLSRAVDKDTKIATAKTEATTYKGGFAADADKVEQYITYRNSLAELEVKRNNATGIARTDLDREIARLKRASVTKSTTGFNAGQLNYLKNLDTIDRDQLHTKQEDTNNEKHTAKNELEQAKRERAKIDTEKAIAEHKRMIDETKFVDGLDSVIIAATAEYLQAQTKEAEEIRAAEIAKLQEVNSDTQKANVLQLLSTRWDERVTARVTRRTINRVNGRQVNTDYNELLTNGPRQMMDSLIPAVGPNMTLEQRNKLLGDTELQGQFVATLLQKRMETSRFSGNEVRRIVGTTWGQEAITKALAQNKAAQEMIQTLEGRGMMRNGFMDWLSRRDDRSLTAILMAILAGAGLGYVGGSLAAAAIGSVAGITAEGAAIAGSAIAGGAAAGAVADRAA